MQDVIAMTMILSKATTSIMIPWTIMLLSIFLCGCSSPAQILGSWKSPELAAQNYQRIVVAALTDNVLPAQERQ